MEINNSLDHLFRYEYGKLVSLLTAKFSSQRIELIEDAVQEALLKAMQIWGYKEIPQNPSGWLYKTAKNYLIDQLRRERKSVDIEISTKKMLSEIELKDEDILSSLSDDQLKMIFACCHPSLNLTEQIMLSLKLIGGLGLSEIANALMKNEEAVKKAITRAKQKFKEKVGELAIPEGRELFDRLEAVLKVIYLIFNEGYKATEGETLIKKDICDEAIRMALILHNNDICDTAELNALLALMFFNASRFDARLDENGKLLTLDKQNYSLWKQNYIEQGLQFLNNSSRGTSISEYHIEAVIASIYSTSNSFEETNWEAILRLYNVLLDINPSPIIKLNRLVVLEKVNGTNEALSQITELEKDGEISNNYLLYTIKADFQKTLGNINEARELLKKAIELNDNSIEKNFLINKLESIK